MSETKNTKKKKSTEKRKHKLLDKYVWNNNSNMVQQQQQLREQKKNENKQMWKIQEILKRLAKHKEKKNMSNDCNDNKKIFMKNFIKGIVARERWRKRVEEKIKLFDRR